MRVVEIQRALTKLLTNDVSIVRAKKAFKENTDYLIRHVTQRGNFCRIRKRWSDVTKATFIRKPREGVRLVRLFENWPFIDAYVASFPTTRACKFVISSKKSCEVYRMKSFRYFASLSPIKPQWGLSSSYVNVKW